MVNLENICNYFMIGLFISAIIMAIIAIILITITIPEIFIFMCIVLLIGYIAVKLKLV